MARSRGAARGESAASEPTLEYAGGVEYWLVRKCVKNVNIRVRSDGSVVVSAPPRASLSEIASFVASKRAWVERCRERAADSPQRMAEQASAAEVAQWRAVVEACVPALVAEWEPIVGVRAGKLAYRNMRSRWGSCQPSTGRICINVRLALYPPECLEYVVVHELCHMLVRGHGPKFHALLDRFMPDWRERRAKLR